MNGLVDTIDPGEHRSVDCGGRRLDVRAHLVRQAYVFETALAINMYLAPGEVAVDGSATLSPTPTPCWRAWVRAKAKTSWFAVPRRTRSQPYWVALDGAEDGARAVPVS